MNEDFMKITHIADLITNPVHNEADQNEIISYLKQLPCFSNGMFDHLTKSLTKKVSISLFVKHLAY